MPPYLSVVGCGKHVIFTGTKSSETWVHLTEPEDDVVTWKTSAHSRQMGMAEDIVAASTPVAAECGSPRPLGPEDPDPWLRRGFRPPCTQSDQIQCFCHQIRYKFC